MKHAAPVSVLLVCANPRGTNPIRTAEEDRVLRECIQLSPNRDVISIDTLNAATIDDLSRSLLRHGYDIVHFSGHGTQTGLAFEGEGGRLMIPSSEALAELLRRHHVKTVVLNACYSLAVGRLMGMGAAFTIASTGAIGDRAAIEFTRGFYDAIGAGLSADDAYKEGLSRVQLKGLSLPTILLRGNESYVGVEISPLSAEPESRAILAVEPAILAGFAIDLSGSMRDSILNDSRGAVTRLESVRHSLRGMSASLRDRFDNTQSGQNFRSFVYGFGLRSPGGIADLVSLSRAATEIDLTAEIERQRRQAESEARGAASQYGEAASFARTVGLGWLVDQAMEAAKAAATDRAAENILTLLLDHAAKIGDSTITAPEFSELWKTSATGLEFNRIEPLIYGNTPMKAVAAEIVGRFERTRRPASGEEVRFLFVISDGEPSDGDPTHEFAAISRNNVNIISCFVTSADIADPRVLWAKSQEGWSEGARLMFEIATPIDERGPLARALLGKGWEIELGARLFVQVNHSTVLDEFIRAIESFGVGGQTDLLPEGR